MLMKSSHRDPQPSSLDVLSELFDWVLKLRHLHDTAPFRSSVQLACDMMNQLEHIAALFYYWDWVPLERDPKVSHCAHARLGLAKDSNANG